MSKNVTRARKKELLLKTPYDSPNYKPHVSHTSQYGDKVMKKVGRYRYGAKEVQFAKEQEVPSGIPQLTGGIGAIMGMIGGGGGGGGIGSMLSGGGGGGGLGSMLGGAKTTGGGGGGGMDMGGMMNMMSSGTSAPKANPETAPKAQPQQSEAKEDGEPVSDSNQAAADVQNRLAQRESGGGMAGNIPVYGQYIKMLDKKLDEHGQALANLNEQGVRLNKYRKGTKGIQKMESGTSYFAGTEDMGGPVVFQKKNPLRKWDNVGKAMKLGTSIAGVLNQPVDKVTGGMASKGTDNVASGISGIGNTTYAGKDYGGSAGNEAMVKDQSNARQGKKPFKETKVGQWGQGVGEKLSQGFKKQNQSDNLTTRAGETPGVAPTTTKPTNAGAATNVSPTPGMTNKGMMEAGLVDPELGIGAATFKKGSRKVKLNKSKYKR